MSYGIYIDEKIQAVCLVHEGEVSWDEMNSARADLNQRAQTLGLKRMLVDASSMTVLPSVTEQFEFVSEHPSNLPRGVRLAIVMRPALLQGALFSEQVSVNRGVAMKVFDSVASARQWLIGTS
ncbi:MAG TPA: hypothetical protein VJU83_02140 [Burkholderiales bacterium]|nr:hypothetical protein [Burkholderiales bacterium]